MNGKNLVLDLDATLIDTKANTREFRKLKLYSDSKKAHLRKKIYILNLVDVITPPGTGVIEQYVGITRPYLREFLEFAFKNFNKVIVWSAGKKKYVRRLCEILFPGKNFPNLIFTYEDCDIQEIGDVNHIEKPLKKLFEKYSDITEKNTLLVDDRLETIKNNGDNGILIPPFSSEMTEEDLENHEDISLIQLMSWFSLKSFKDCTDVRELYKDDIFDISLEKYSEQIKKEKRNSLK